MVKCSVVIRCYNEEQHIGRLLSGIMEQSVRDVEIILVDSGSTDATVGIAVSDLAPIRAPTSLRSRGSRYKYSLRKMSSHSFFS
ncbi:MAG: glycosyltransferase [Microcoleus sp.]